MTDPTRVPPMTQAEIDQALSDVVGPLTFAPPDEDEPTASDPTKNVPWRAVRNEYCDMTGTAVVWEVFDSSESREVLACFEESHYPPGVAEALARTVAAGPDAASLRSLVADMVTAVKDNSIYAQSSGAASFGKLNKEHELLARAATLTEKDPT